MSTKVLSEGSLSEKDESLLFRLVLSFSNVKEVGLHCYGLDFGSSTKYHIHEFRGKRIVLNEEVIVHALI